MNELLSGTLFFGVAVSLGGYQLGVFLKKKLGWPFLSPLLIAFLFCIGFLLLFRIDYETYKQSAEYISYFLTPATVCLAIPLYQQLHLLKRNALAILLGITAGVLASFLSILLLCKAFGLTATDYATLMPKSITAAIGVEMSAEYGGNVTFTVVATMFTGILGNVAAGGICKLLHITEPIAKGLAAGNATHLMGTSKAMEMGETEGAMASLAVLVAGLLSLVAAPLFVTLI